VIASLLNLQGKPESNYRDRLTRILLSDRKKFLFTMSRHNMLNSRSVAVR